MAVLFGGRGIASRALLSRALALTGGPLPLPEITTSDKGKPYFPQHPALHFSLSHSGDLTLCALGDRPLGVDIEIIKKRKARLPYYALTGREFVQYEAMGSDWASFYTLWTKKEAWVKYTGLGLGKGMRLEIDETGLHFGHYKGQDWVSTFCGEEAPPECIIWLDF